MSAQALRRGFRAQVSTTLMWCAAGLVGVFGTSLPVVAEAAASAPSPEALPDQMLEVAEELGYAAAEVLATYGLAPDETGRIGNMGVAYAQDTGTVQVSIYGAEDEIVASGSAWGQLDVQGRSLDAVIELQQGDTTRLLDVNFRLEAGALVWSGHITVVSPAGQDTYAGELQYQDGEFAYGADNDPEFNAQLEAMFADFSFSGDFGEMVGGITVTGVIILAALLLVGLGLLCAALGECGPVGGIFTRIGEWLQSILL